jgi:hypothetical protein
MALLVILSKQFWAQSIYFNFKNGTSASYNLTDVKKITFTADVMNLHLLNGSVHSWNVSTIGFYEYNPNTINVESLNSSSSLIEVITFPNPSNNYINVKYNLKYQDEIKIEVYDLQGKLVIQTLKDKKLPGEYNELIDFKNLTSGIYTCKVIGKNEIVSKQIIKN